MNQPKDNDIDQDTESIDIFNSDLENINVNVWFNKLESRLQYCLVKDNANEGFMQYKMLVAHAELLAISSNKIDEEEYREDLEKELKERKLKGEQTVKEMKESMIKYKLILKKLLKAKKSDLNISF